MLCHGAWSLVPLTSLSLRVLPVAGVTPQPQRCPVSVEAPAYTLLGDSCPWANPVSKGFT